MRAFDRTDMVVVVLGLALIIVVLILFGIYVP